MKVRMLAKIVAIMSKIEAVVIEIFCAHQTTSQTQLHQNKVHTRPKREVFQ